MLFTFANLKKFQYRYWFGYCYSTLSRSFSVYFSKYGRFPAARVGGDPVASLPQSITDIFSKEEVKIPCLKFFECWICLVLNSLTALVKICKLLVVRIILLLFWLSGLLEKANQYYSLHVRWFHVFRNFKCWAWFVCEGLSEFKSFYSNEDANSEVMKLKVWLKSYIFFLENISFCWSKWTEGLSWMVL